MPPAPVGRGSPGAGPERRRRRAGEDPRSLLHEGAMVTEGVKYIVRTDVLYMNV
jgi:hypothetical protein